MNKGTGILAGGATIAAASLLFANGPIITEAAAQETAPAPQWSWPEHMENPQVLPEDTDVARLRGTMIGFVFGLGVRCSYCHVGTGDDLSQYDFASDDNPNKESARGMMRMTWAINTDHLPAVSSHEPDWQVTCFTCHRGSVLPLNAPPAEQ
jgi:hypothetical protein